MNKISVVGCLLVGMSVSVSYLACDSGGAFVGGFGGSLLGSAVGTSMAQKSRGDGGDGSGAEALKEVGKLENAFRNDLQTLNGRIDDIEEDVKELQKSGDSKELRDEIALVKKSFGDVEKKMNEQFEKIEQRLVALESKPAEKVVSSEPAAPVEKVASEEK